MSDKIVMRDSPGRDRADSMLRPDVASDARWIVELQHDCWLAPWCGDPGRTLVLGSAKQYSSAHAAKCALSRAKRVFPARDYSQARVSPIGPVDSNGTI